MTQATKEYFELVRRVPLLPIDDDQQLEAANALAVELAIKSTRGSLSSAEQGYFQVLSGLITQYENKRFSFGPKPTPVELVRSLMEDNGLSQVDMAPLFGGQSRVSDFLAGKRDLSKSQIQKLSARFALSAAAFLAEPEAQRRAGKKPANEAIATTRRTPGAASKTAAKHVKPNRTQGR